jgi:hypothetical protein
LKILICSKYYFQKWTQFSNGNNVPGDPASNTHGFLWIDICVSSTRWIGLFGTTWAFLHLENYDFQELFLSETNSILTGKQCTRCCKF